MSRTEFMALNGNQVNVTLNHHGVRWEHLPASVRRRAKYLAEEAQRVGAGDVAYDMAMNDKGAAIERAQAKAGKLVDERGQLLRSEFAKLLARKGAIV